MAKAAVKVSKVEQELRELTGIKPNAKEGRQAFLARLSGKISELQDGDWENLSSDAQTWANDASKTVEEGTDLVDFSAPAKSNGDEDSKPKKGNSNGPKKASAKVKGGEGKGTEIKVQIKRMVFKDPSVSVQAIMDALAKRGTVPSKLTVSSIRAEFRHTLRFLRDEGILKVDI